MGDTIDQQTDAVSVVGRTPRDDRATGRRSPSPLLSWEHGGLLRGGRPHQMFSGSVHYFRVHPRQWRDRLVRAVDLGLNTIDTYVPWNFHRPRPDRPADFTGWRDVEAFVETAGGLGLDVVVRPGPYICAEWSNGGLPAWLTARTSALRTATPSFLEPVEAWFDDLLPRLAPLQAGQGGPVVAFQVENEYGSFGDDAVYVDWVARQLRGHDLTEMLYTADGPTAVMLDGGTVPGVLSAVTMGSKPEAARAMLSSRRPDEPFVVAEFWNGWFDHWGRPHHVRDAQNARDTLEGIVADGGSVSVYMAHGGTNFGLWAGANDVDGDLRPTVTSYDSDAPIAEDGRLTEKFHALRAVLGAGDRAVVSEAPRFLPRASWSLRAGARLDDALSALAGPGVVDQRPAPSFEDLGLDSGLVRYSSDVVLPDAEVTLHFRHVADRGLVSVDGQPVGVIDERGSLVVRGAGRTARLEVLVENLGRVNYGPRTGERKGLLGQVSVERRLVQVWDAVPLDVEAWDVEGWGDDLLSSVEAASPDVALDEIRPAAGGAGLARAAVDVDEPLDAHLALPGSTKGFVWLNGTLLGRYWNIGPQQTLYAPAPLWRHGTNSVVVLDLHGLGETVEVRDRAELGPEEQYVEEF